MESLCRRVRKLSVSASNVVQDESTNNLVGVDFVESKSEPVEVDDEAQVSFSETLKSIYTLRSSNPVSFCSGWKPTNLTSIFTLQTYVYCHLMVLR